MRRICAGWPAALGRTPQGTLQRRQIMFGISSRRGRPALVVCWAAVPEPRDRPTCSIGQRLQQTSPTGQRYGPNDTAGRTCRPVAKAKSETRWAKSVLGASRVFAERVAVAGWLPSVLPFAAVLRSPQGGNKIRSVSQIKQVRHVFPPLHYFPSLPGTPTEPLLKLNCFAHEAIMYSCNRFYE
ncbi:hypothetical protein L209DRAFT_377636 [Thermothelomyces heterothallicus CBS 203.75]